MGYEVDANTLDAFAQHLLSQLVDEKEERFGTYKEKDLDLQKKFTEPTRKRKVKKEVKELAEKMALSKEVVQRDREKNILKEEDMAKPKKSKSVSTPPKQSKTRQSQSVPTSGVQKFVPPPKPQTTSTSGAKKRNKEKPTRKYVAVEEETQSDEEIKEVKKTSTYVRVVKKPQFSGAQLSKKPRAETESSKRARVGKKQKSKLDETLKSDKVERTYEVVPPMTLKQVIDEVLKDGNMCLYTMKFFDDKDQRAIEKVVVQYMDIYSKMKSLKRQIQFLIDQRIDVNPTHDDTHSEDQSHDTFVLEVHEASPDKKKDQSSKKAIAKGKSNDQTTIDDVDAANDISDEAEQDPPVIKVVLEKATEETIDVDKGEDDGHDASVEGEEKGEEKSDQAPTTVARDTVIDKGKQIATDSDDFGQGPIDLSSLSLIQALKLATLTQVKTSEDLLKSHSVDKELIILARDVLDKILPSFKPDTFDPSGN
ncbi:uncharacterized protein LOC131874100 [Cryptomeria japonica]|uniref:uncharacterized protein LOC131874100 n=1 Tax=Cryptomeria japonica TaxID=3369 RepID=UPI0027DA71C7|nr:uncharacterized protein LOC131874100 [Cryptomeria japonica]